MIEVFELTPEELAAIEENSVVIDCGNDSWPDEVYIPMYYRAILPKEE